MTDNKKKNKPWRKIKKEKRKEEEKRKQKEKKPERKKERKKNKERKLNFFSLTKKKECLHIAFYFFPAIFILIALVIILLYCKYRCTRESGREAGPLDQAVVPAFVVPAGVPEWVTTPRLLCMHYYFSSMFTLVRETAQLYFPGPQLAGSTETVELGVI